MGGEPRVVLGDRFELGDLVGVGATASVYAARDATGGPSVAVKVLHPHLSARPQAREAFLREAHATQRVQNPNVAAVRATGVHEIGGVSFAWIALELVTGGTLVERVAADGAMGPVEAAAVLDGVLAALEAAHAVGLVHRDVSPGNVLLARPAKDGPACAADVRLTDFGLADATGRSTRGRDVLRSDVDTDTEAGSGAHADGSGGVIGSAQFMSPEQAQGKPVRASGDLYQVGALGYFLLTGQPPYPRLRPVDVLAAHVSAPPPVPSALAAAAAPLDRVITHAMAKAPTGRFRDATEFRAALAAAMAAPRAARQATVGDLGAGTRMLEPGGAAPLEYLEPTGSASEATWRPAAAPSSVFAGVVTVAVLAAAVWGTFGAAAGSAPTVVPSPSPSTTVSAAPAPLPTVGPVDVPPTEPAEPSVPAVVTAPVLVPGLAGTLTDAEQALFQVGLLLGNVTYVWSAQATGQVLAQQPAAGAQAAAGSRVDVTVASGLNEIPLVAGLSATSAADMLRSAGFVVELPTGAMGPVRGTTPAVGAVHPVGTTVELLVAAPPQATPTEAPTTTPTPAPTVDPPPTGEGT